MRFINNLKVRSKLSFLIIIGSLVALILGLIAFTETNEMSNDMETVYNEKFIPNNWIHNAVNVNLRIDTILVQLMLLNDAEEKKELHSEINNGVDEVLADFATYESMDLTAEEEQGVAAFYDAVTRLTDNQDEMIRLALANKNEDALKLYNEVVKDARLDLIAALNDLSDIKAAQTEALSAKNVDAAEQTAIKIVILCIVGILILIFIGIGITRSITKPIHSLNGLLVKVREGDFTVRGDYEGKNELGQLTSSFNDTISSIQHALKTVSDAAHTVDDTAHELSANVSQTSASSTHIVSSIQEIAAGSEQTKTKLETNAVVINSVQNGFVKIEDAFENLNTLAKVSIGHSEEGAAIVKTNVEQMQNIKNSIEQSNEVILNLADRVNSVDEILSAINAISGQTNLLALNAAIEAARAGEHGKGFAVVADEVRKLAEQSLESTKSIAQILASVKEDTVQSVQIMNIVMKDSHEGLMATQNTQQKFDDILTSSEAVAPHIHNLNETMVQLNADFNSFAGSADTILNIAVNNASNTELVTAATEQNSSAIEDMSDSARSLSEVASQLNQMTQQFKL